MAFLLACHELWWLSTPKGVTSGMRKELELANVAGLVIRKYYKDPGGGFEMANVWSASQGIDNSWQGL